MRDCIFLLADENMKAAFEGFLSRDQFHKSLVSGSFEFDATQDLAVASGDNDPGLYTRGHELLRPYLNTHSHAVIALDVEWAGSPGTEAITKHITKNLIQTGWTQNNCKVIAIDPELENWIWQRNNHVANALGVSSATDFPRVISTEEWSQDQAKPIKPKETLEKVLRANRIPRSSAIYKKITSRVSVKYCQDNSFQELLTTLRTWFPAEFIEIGEVAE